MTIVASATAGSSDSRTASGTAVENYRFEDAPFAWIDATAGGTNTGIALDDTSVTVSLPFAFSFYGQACSSVTTSALANGTVGQAYSQTLVASGGTPPRTWSLPSRPCSA